MEGKNLAKLDNEAGGHRVQRIPPTERKGRVHTSTVTVAVIDPDEKSEGDYSKTTDDDFRIEWFSGTGKGGQHRNKRKNSCRLVHIPTGIVETRQGRKREANLREAMESLLARLEAEATSETLTSQAALRKKQVGSGMRGDKIRTIRIQDDRAVDNRTGKRMSAKRYMKGHMDELWPDDIHTVDN